MTIEKEFRRTRVDETIIVPAPAVATGIDYAFGTFDIQTNTRLMLKNVYFTFTSDVNAANRALVISIEDHLGRVVYSASHETPITASLVTLVNMKDILYKDWDAVSLLLGLPLPDLYLRQDYSITVAITNVQVGDQLGGMYIRHDRYEGVILDE